MEEIRVLGKVLGEREEDYGELVVKDNLDKKRMKMDVERERNKEW